MQKHSNSADRAVLALLFFALFALFPRSTQGQHHHDFHGHSPFPSGFPLPTPPVFPGHHDIFFHGPDLPGHEFILSAIPVPRAVPQLKLPSPVSDQDFHNNGVSRNPSKIELGRLLFFDKELGGNRNISCATCHHPFAATGDDLSLSVGEGANGTGRDRNLGLGGNAVVKRVPRNAQPLFNLGAREYTRFFFDGRVEVKNGAFISPAGKQLPGGLDNQLAVQAMFPVTSADEMAGQEGENDVANASAAKQLSGAGGVWDLLSKRLRRHPRYVELFKSAFPGDVRSAKDITFVHAANALAAYEALVFRSDNSPFDQYLRGNRDALSETAETGMNLFYGKAGCSTCHSGKFQTDHQFHAIALPQIGPGKDHGYRKREDYGREGVTKQKSDRYKFRTPALRNVAITGPWGHDGAYATLEAMIYHHLDPINMLHHYASSSAFFPRRPDLDSTDFDIHNHPESRAAIARANELKPVYLSHTEVTELVTFLHALTDQRARNLRGEIPDSVPSGLPVSDYVYFPEPGHAR